MSKLEIYTDGACRGNGKVDNIGAWATVIMWNGKTKELSGIEHNTTNNKMELLSCIKALEFIKSVKNTSIEITTDSNYLFSGMSKGWVTTWKRDGWIKKFTKEPVKNKELWEQLINLTEDKQITWFHVRGHADNEYNNRCDELCNIALDNLKM